MGTNTKARGTRGAGRGSARAKATPAATQDSQQAPAPYAGSDEFAKARKKQISALKRQITMGTKTRQAIAKQGEAMDSWLASLKSEQEQLETA